jgi:16S rRNA (guanine966-N2)-methyltransferase
MLDLFAGSGALGIEALSRGVPHATFVDSGKQAIASVRANLAELGIADLSLSSYPYFGV